MLARIYHRLTQIAARLSMPVLMISVVVISNVSAPPSEAAINLSPVGSGFTVTAADLAYILKQIKIAERHSRALAGGANPNLEGDPVYCQSMIGIGPDQIASPLISDGIRTVDGSCNNLQPNQAAFGAADQAFPRLTTPLFKPAELPGPFGAPGVTVVTDYAQTSGAVVDSQPRMVSNLIVDQTSTNPAAVAVAGNPARTQANPDIAFPCETTGNASGCTPQYQTLFIPNVTTDVGLSPPFNSLFTIFGQFFDHGLDKISNGGAGAVFVPLKDDDPLVAGPDHIFADDLSTFCTGVNVPSGCDESADNLPAKDRFMVLTRGTIKNDPAGLRSAPNTDTPFVDQSQTYTSHSSHQVFLREYILNASNKPVATGKFLSTSDGGMATWSMIKTQAADMLGLQLVDVDVNNIPMIAADPYGNFIPGPVRGLPQYVTATGLVEADLLNPVPAPADVTRIDTAFLNDIAHSAGPGSIASPKTPDSNTTAGGSLDPVATGEYDNELLDLHYICGDGRCNENIGLTAIHQVFHMEHDRLVDYFYHDEGTNIPGSVSGVLPQNPELLAAYQAVNLTPGSPDKTFTFQERLFQAARFVTEMQYQHLVFEEFARKVQPAINAFPVFALNQTDINPAISAEFAHAVYRFGHSMLNETIPRTNADGSHNDISLLDGFLNPGAFNDGGSAGVLSSPYATGAIIMGLSDQTGNEIDEFVSDTLRNSLLGLPLDLPSLNMARARSEGIPSLNNVRKQIFAATNDGQLAPYPSWFSFGEEMKHPESLVNFIAAYGTHPKITELDPDGAGPILAGSLKARRMAADQIVNGTTLPGPDNTLGTDDDIFAPSNRSSFMFSLGGDWANIDGVSRTGLDDIDLWVGGLAEKTNLFGGLLGTTFNYVFEKQLTDLQNGDRFYYLARTPGMNLRSQLEGNSFAELVMRNTNAHSLKADPFANADCKFQLANLNATAAGFTLFGSTVQDDPASECNETALLVRLPDGTIKYRSINTVDPRGINGQAVYNGTDFADNFFGGNDNDTFWGGLGNDRMEGGGGDDVMLGGLGDDIMTDSSGFDTMKGGPGNDAMDGGIGDDIMIGGDGKDFINGGGNNNFIFAGPGDDFILGGTGIDEVIADGGDDWLEGGDLADLLIGDSSSLFFDDHNRPGHDILNGQGGDDDYDMEGGDDIGVAGPGVEKVAGASGYDWEIGLSDPQAQDADLALPIVNVLPVNGVRDRYNEVEALSGWNFNDTLRGDSVIPSQVNGGGFIGCDALDATGVARIRGLDALVKPAMLTVPSAPIIAASATNYCLLTGNVWGEGNILLGGAGSDTLEGRGANDILDGDKYLNVRLSVLAGVDANGEATGTELGSTGLMEKTAVTGDFGAGTTGMTLQQAVFAGKVNPGQIVAVREILLPTTVPAADCGAAVPVNCDTALFSGPAAGYTITGNIDASVTVIDNNVAPRDGTDTLWNMERLVFCDVPDPLIKGACLTPAAPITVAPAATVSPASLLFGDQAVNTQLTRIITVRNTGINNLIVSGVTITGASSFTIGAHDCATVTRGGSCTINVRFRPTAVGPASANVLIAHNAVGSPTSVSLSGNGTAAIAGVTPSLLAFGDRSLNTNLDRVVTLSNTGTANLVITSTTVSGAGFTRLAGGCGASLPVGSSCSITVRFRPTVTGPVVGSLSISDNSIGVNPQIVTLTGTGVLQNPIASVSAPALSFGNLQVGSVAQLPVTLTNTGTGSTPMAITGIAVTGAGFTRVGALPGNCGTTLAAGASCIITVQFAPTTGNGGGGNRVGSLVVTDNSGNVPGSTQAVALSGTGTISAINDANLVNANNVNPQVVDFNVRTNDLPSAGTVALVAGSSIVVNGGATVTVGLNPANLNQVRWTLTPPVTATTNAARQASKRGTYTVNYILTNGGATATATYTLTVQ